MNAEWKKEGLKSSLKWRQWRFHAKHICERLFCRELGLLRKRSKKQESADGLRRARQTSGSCSLFLHLLSQLLLSCPFLSCIKKRKVPGLTRKQTDCYLSTDQIFAYVIVIDFESTCWQDQKYRQHEISKYQYIASRFRLFRPRGRKRSGSHCAVTVGLVVVVVNKIPNPPGLSIFSRS